MLKYILMTLILFSGYLFSQDSLKVIWGMVDSYGEEFTDEILENITFSAYIHNYRTGYDSEVTTNLDSGNVVENYSNIRGVCIIDFTIFEDWTWSDDDELRLYVREDLGESYLTAEGTWEIPENIIGINYRGFDPYVPETGTPINYWTIHSPIDEAQIGVEDYNNEIFDFSTVPYDNVTFQCWISGREEDVINQNSSGSGYIDYAPDVSALTINRHAFESTWVLGDTLNVKIINDVNGNGYYSGEKKFVFYRTHSFSHYGPSFLSFGLDSLDSPFGGGGGEPVKVDIWHEGTSIECNNNFPMFNELYQNYPNPFNPTTEIKFALPTASEVKLNVYNINGQIVSELVNGRIEAGIHSVNFNATNYNSGMYFYTLEANGTRITKKMILTK
jgi:hypothetical protein